MHRAMQPPRPLEPGEGWCTRCRTIKPAADFCRNRTRPNGLAAWCRACLYPKVATYGSSRQVYWWRRRHYGSSLYGIPIGQKRDAIKNGTWLMDGLGGTA